MENGNIIYEDGCAVGTFAGTGKKGHREGTKGEAQFSAPTSVALDQNGDMYVADYENHRLRKISATDGSVRTVAGTGESGFKDGPAREAQFDRPHGIAIGTNGDIIIAESPGNRIRAFSPSTNAVTTLVDAEAGLSHPTGVAVCADGSIVVSDAHNHRIVKICPVEGAVKVVAGSGRPGYASGDARNARFCFPWGVAVCQNGDIYVADKNNHRIRKIHASTGLVTTLAGSGQAGWHDGGAQNAQFKTPRDVAIGADGCVYISDGGNNCVRKWDPVDGRVATVAGATWFKNPNGVVLGCDGVLYVVDSGNHRIQAMTPSSTIEPESELQDIEKELEKKKQRINELAHDIRDATASTATATAALEQTKNATLEAHEELAEAQNDLKIKRIALQEVLEQRKAELQAVNGEVCQMENAKAQCDAELASAKAELDEARAALDVVTTEKAQYVDKLQLANAQLRRANGKDSNRRGAVVGEEGDGGFEELKSEEVSDTTETKTDKESDAFGEVVGETPTMTSGTAGVEASAERESDSGLETSWSKQQVVDGEGNIADPLQRVEKSTGTCADLVEKHGDTLQAHLDPGKTLPHEDRALEKEEELKDAAVEKTVRLSKYTEARGPNTHENKTETIKDNN